MKIRSQTHPKIQTFDPQGNENGFLIPIYNENDKFFEIGKEPKQVYLTVISPGCYKGPHLHKIRTGFFTCIKGNIRIIVKIEGNYEVFYSGENHNFLSIEVPTNVAALIQNLGDEDAYMINMPNPAWTPSMHDEYDDDFSDFFQNENSKRGG